MDKNYPMTPYQSVERKALFSEYSSINKGLRKADTFSVRLY